PPGVEIDAKADAAAILAEMLNGETQPPRAARAEHEPVTPLRKVLVLQSVGEHLVIDTEVVRNHSALRDAGRPASLDDVPRLVLQATWDPAVNRAPAEPLVLEEWELLDVLPPVHVLERVEVERLGLLQPERRPGVGAEVPADDLADLRVELSLRVLDSLFERGTGDRCRLAGRIFHINSTDRSGGMSDIKRRVGRGRR